LLIMVCDAIYIQAFLFLLFVSGRWLVGDHVCGTDLGVQRRDGVPKA
jgi:hypothetical protein